MNNKLFVPLIALMFSLTFVSAYSYNPWGWDFYGISPSELLQNEWFVFGGIFLLVFAFVYFSLSNFFTREHKNKMFPWLSETQENKGPVFVISLVIALFTAAAFAQKDYLSQYMGEAVTIWITIVVLIVMVILSIPFYKALKASVGGVIAGVVIIALIWGGLNIINPYELVPSASYNESFQQFYEAVTSPVILLVILGVIGVAYLIKSSRRS